MSCCECVRQKKQELSELLNTKYSLEDQLKCYSQEIERLSATVEVCECCRDKRIHELEHFIIAKSEVERDLERVISRIDCLMVD